MQAHGRKLKQNGGGSMNGYCGKMLFVDLTKGSCEDKVLTEDMATQFIGGYGIGAKVLFGMMKPGADALGPENVLGFTTGPLTGTGALLSGRYTVVCKSPVSGGWNDANSGGYFGPELKKAGYDAVFVQGASKEPVYIWIHDGKAEIRDAAHLWGKDVLETEEALKAELGDSKIRAALIGPAGEKRSLIAAVINDEHRAAGRGGCGAVMGSKKLKAVVVRGNGSVPVADPQKLKAANQEIMDTIKNGPAAEIAEAFSNYGTTLFTAASAVSGDSPVKNWGGVGVVDYGEEAANKLEGVPMDDKYRAKKYSCANCPLGCGAIFNVKDGKWPVGETGRPEYETAAAFGVLVLNDNAEAVLKCNHICNIYGLDTISAGMTVAWAIECFENGVLTKDETGGIELAWGNAEALVQATQEMADQSTEFGKLLALGSAGAAEKIGKGTEYLVTVKGIELPMHDPKLGPGFSRTYAFDPTPARHVKGGLGLEHMQTPDDSKYNAEGSGEPDLRATVAQEIINTAGLCLFKDFTGVENIAWKLIPPVTGWDFGEGEEMNAGLRIFNMRHAFNLREGMKPGDLRLPKRSVGEPPQTEGPLAGVTVDHKGFIRNFFEAIDWDETTGKPSRASLEKLGGMDDVIQALDL
jgi:aldehyde:ferredoxin oxidoreductase